MSARCRPLAVQNQYDLLNGEDPNRPGVLDYSAAGGMSFIAWSPLARGLLTERYLDPSKVGPGDRLVDEGTLSADASDDVMTRLRGLAELAHEWSLKVSQLAIAYILTLPGMGPVISSVSSVDQLESNAVGGKTQLSQDQAARVRAVLAG